MYKLCKTEQSAHRQRQLEQGLLRMMLKCQFEEISVSWEDVLAVIAEVKGVGPKILANIDKKLKEKY